MASRTPKVAMNFDVMKQAAVPQGRNGKHKSVVTKLLSDLDQIPKDAALKVPLAELPDSKAKIRSALNRASRKAGRRVATASDDAYLYVWNETPVAER
jgi:hypothetical protein